MCECAWYYRGVNCRFIIYGAIPHVCALKRDRTPQNEPPANELPAKGSQVSGLRKVSEKRETLSPKTSKSQNSRRFEGSGIRNSEHSREIQNPPPPLQKKEIHDSYGRISPCVSLAFEIQRDPKLLRRVYFSFTFSPRFPLTCLTLPGQINPR